MVQSIDRAMSIISILVSDDSKQSWSISDLAQQTALPLGTLHRILSTLIRHGLVAQVPETKQYKAGYKWMEIGLRLLDKIDIRIAARPVMERLAAEVEESIYLSIPSGTDGIIIEKVDSPLKVRINENLGDRIPLHIGAPNKTMLAQMREEEVKAILQQLLPTEQIPAFHTQLAEVKKNGYAVSFGEKTENTCAVAAAVIGYQHVAGSISIGGPSFRFTEERLPLLIQKVKESAEEISVYIGKI